MKKVLVVDDNLGIRKFVSLALRKEGYEVVEACDGEAALISISLHKDIDLILLDIMMPNMNGMELLEKMKTYLEEFNVTVCMMTAKEQRETIKDCLIGGATDYIVKPVDRKFLAEKVHQLLNGETKSTFFECKAEASGRILKAGGSIDIVIKKISEYEVIFSSTEKIPVPLKAAAKIPALENILGNENSFFLSIYTTLNLDGELLYRASFIGLNERDSNLLRSAAMKKEFDNEE